MASTQGERRRRTNQDIIGEWDDGRWSGVFTWENVPGWKLRLKTSKNRAAAVFTISNYPLLFPLLEAVPHDERMGAIIKGEHNLPIRERSYRKFLIAACGGLLALARRRRKSA